MPDMDLNPYQSPQFAQSRRAEETQSRLPVDNFEIVIVVSLIVIILAAIDHRYQLPDPTDNNAASAGLDAYKQSPLIAVEMLGMIWCMMVPPMLVMHAVYLFLHQ